MRNEIFYWKCDSPIPPEQKIHQFFQSKYTEEIRALVHDAVRDFLGHAPDELTILNSDGNHLVATFREGATTFFFRADEGKAIDDAYLLTESTIMNLLNKKGLPVPPVYHTDITMARYPFRFQIMEFSDFPSLNKFAKENTLDEFAIARQSGHFLAQVHALGFPGYGFFNTDKMARGEAPEGLDESPEAYFRKCLEKHIGYLVQHGLVSGKTEERIRTAFGKAMPLLKGIPGSLLHRDYAYWNILGTRDRIMRVIDWDDCVSGDPADDFGIINCFLSEALVNEILKSYGENATVDESFRTRIHLHTVRNMLWKTMIRDYMGYFDKGQGFFLTGGDGLSLREYTLRKLETELQKLEEAL